MAFIKKVLFVFMLVAIVLLALLVYCLANFDAFKGKLTDKVSMVLDKVSVDSSKLIEKNAKLKLHFIINNGLPMSVAFRSLVFDMNVGDSNLAKNMLAESKVDLKPNIDTNVIIGCDVDSIIARRAIQKAVEKNASQILKSLLGAKSVKNALGEDIRAITSIKGKANFVLKFWSLEIPLVKEVAF